MEPWRLKREYGRDLSFLGGFDIQGLLPYGSVDDIRRGVALLIDEYGHDGGFIFAAGYVIQYNTPPENIVAMSDAAHELGRYPLPRPSDETKYVDFLRSLHLSYQHW